MDTKLTLKLDKFVIEQAKEYASSHKRSLSRIIEAYLKSLVNQSQKNDDDDIFIADRYKHTMLRAKIIRKPCEEIIYSFGEGIFFQ